MDEDELTDLMAVKTGRALTDPVIVHEPTRDFAPPSDSEIYTYVDLARLRQNMETPVNERIEYASWPETTIYLSTASFDSSYANGRFAEAYEYAFSETMENWSPHSLEELPVPFDEAPELMDYRKDQLDTLRFAIKKDRDKYWVENHYDSDEYSFPKGFFLTDYETELESEDLDEFSQSALDEFR